MGSRGASANARGIGANVASEIRTLASDYRLGKLTDSDVQGVLEAYEVQGENFESMNKYFQDQVKKVKQNKSDMPVDVRKDAVREINDRIAALGKERYAERRAKLVKQRQLLENNTVYAEAPKGWRLMEGATTAPRGYAWYSDGKSAFSGDRKIALVRMGDE